MYIYMSSVCLTWCSFGIIHDPPIASAVFPSERGASFDQALLKPNFYGLGSFDCSDWPIMHHGIARFCEFTLWRCWRTFGIVSYCWWLKSCTTWDVWNPINNGKSYLSTGAGFQPSTVLRIFLVQLSQCFFKKALVTQEPWRDPWWNSRFLTRKSISNALNNGLFGSFTRMEFLPSFAGMLMY